MPGAVQRETFILTAQVLTTALGGGGGFLFFKREKRVQSNRMTSQKPHSSWNK